MTKQAAILSPVARVLVIDSYDSFVYNLVQYLGELGAEPIVVRNDQLSVVEAVALRPDAVLLSPGCASYDWYTSYAERGDDFARAVRETIGAAS